MAAIGFVGLGNMGGPMAANLIKAGHKLRVFDISEAAMAKARGRGRRRLLHTAKQRKALKRSSPCCQPDSMCERSISARKGSFARLRPARS